MSILPSWLLHCRLLSFQAFYNFPTPFDFHDFLPAIVGRHLSAENFVTISPLLVFHCHVVIPRDLFSSFQPLHWFVADSLLSFLFLLLLFCNHFVFVTFLLSCSNFAVMILLLSPQFIIRDSRSDRVSLVPDGHFILFLQFFPYMKTLFLYALIHISCVCLQFLSLQLFSHCLAESRGHQFFQIK